MNYSCFQNRDLYVVKAFKDNVGDATADPVVAPEHVAAVGDIEVGVLDNGIDKELFFIYQGADTPLKSDYIPLKNLTYIKAFKSSDLATKMKKVKVTLNTSIGTSGLINGQSYTLKIEVRPAFGIGTEHAYAKTASVYVDGADVSSASSFYKAMVQALNKSFAKEYGATATSNPYFRFAILYSTSSESEEGDSNWSGATAAGIIIEEKEQQWITGLGSNPHIDFEVFPGEVLNNGVQVVWAAKASGVDKYYTEMTPSTTVGNGKNIADLEWFCTGERGDQYKMMGWPNYIPTTYLVDKTKTYDVLEIHFAFTDDGLHNYRSEKDITIVVPNGTAGHEHDVINALIGDINSKADLSVATLS